MTHRLHRDDAARLRLPLRATSRLLLAAGAREVLTGLPRSPSVRDVAELDVALGDLDPRRLHLAASQPSRDLAILLKRVSAGSQDHGGWMPRPGADRAF